MENEKPHQYNNGAHPPPFQGGARGGSIQNPKSTSPARLKSKT